jgi:lysozyme
MKTSTAGAAFIAAHEGVVTRAYRDVRGTWTIGVGHTAAAGAPRPKAGMTMTRDEALALLARDLGQYEAGVGHALPDAAQTAFDGAVSFHFNTGAIARATWVKKYRADDAAEAEAGLKAWNKAGGRIYKGLVRRRAEEADLIFRGAYPAGIDGDASRAASSSTAEVESLQRALAELGAALEVDGIDGPATRAAVLAFQRGNDLVADGIAGPATRATLERRLAEKRARAATAGAAAGGAATGGAVGAKGGQGLPLDTLIWIGGGALAAAIAVALILFAWRRRGAAITAIATLTARKT